MSEIDRSLRAPLPILSSSSPACVAFVTRLEQPALTADDALAVEPLAARGIEVVAAPWDDRSIDWSGFDAIVPRSCWDYHVRPRRFAAVVDSWDQTRLPSSMR